MAKQDMRSAVAEHYELLLGLKSPWRVKTANLDLGGRKVDIEVEYDPKRPVYCPQCGDSCRRHDHAPMRTWRHLDVMQFTTEIRACIPRVHCEKHGVQTLVAPWAEPGSRFTVLFEAFAVQLLLATGSLEQAAQMLKLDWDSVQRIMDRAVERGMIRRSTEEVTLLGFDEKSFGKGQKYISHMTDHSQRRILDVVPDRTQEAAEKLWSTLPKSQREKVLAVTMDMSAGFASAAKIAAPQADIVYDKFHVHKHLNEGVDLVRREEHQRLSLEGDKTLAKTKYLWLKNGGLDERSKLKFEELCELGLKTADAWYHKELFTEFWAQDTKEEAQTFFELWHAGVLASELKPMIKVAKTIFNHLEGILNYFSFPISNGIVEGFNSRIQSIKSAARGFRNFKNYRTRIMFYCGKLDLAPNLPLASCH